MSRAGAVAGASLLMAVALATGPTEAGAATLAKAGWWWRLNDPALPVPIPPPPTVPEGGLMVAGAPDGATAIAAVSFELDEGEASPVLTLTTVRETGGEGAIMAACVTGSFWNPASAGRWNEKPSAACEEGSVTGVRAVDGSSWSFALAPLVSDGLIDVVVVAGTIPGAQAGAPTGSTFEIVFEAPTASSLSTGAGTGGGDAPPIDAPDFGAPSEAVVSPPPIGESFTPPAIGAELALPPSPAAGFTPALPEADQGLTATAPVAQQQNPPLAAGPISKPDVGDARTLAAVVLALGGAAALWASQRSASSTSFGRFSVAGGAPEGLPGPPGGLGRFARPRTGTVPRL